MIVRSNYAAVDFVSRRVNVVWRNNLLTTMPADLSSGYGPFDEPQTDAPVRTDVGGAGKIPG